MQRPPGHGELGRPAGEVQGHDAGHRQVADAEHEGQHGRTQSQLGGRLAHGIGCQLRLVGRTLEHLRHVVRGHGDARDHVHDLGEGHARMMPVRLL